MVQSKVCHLALLVYVLGFLVLPCAGATGGGPCWRWHMIKCAWRQQHRGSIYRTLFVCCVHTCCLLCCLGPLSPACLPSPSGLHPWLPAALSVYKQPSSRSALPRSPEPGFLLTFSSFFGSRPHIMAACSPVSSVFVLGESPVCSVSCQLIAVWLNKPGLALHLGSDALKHFTIAKTNTKRDTKISWLSPDLQPDLWAGSHWLHP